jgi:hypothetical protein
MDTENNLWVERLQRGNEESMCGREEGGFAVKMYTELA